MLQGSECRFEPERFGAVFQKVRLKHLKAFPQLNPCVEITGGRSLKVSVPEAI